MALEKFLKPTLETADSLRIIDDTLFRLVAERKEVCQEILRTLLEMPELKVLNVTVQENVQSLHREIVLDVLCETEDGSLVNIEMQKGSSNDDIRRCRFHASALTAKYTSKGTAFSDVPTVKILYVTKYDALENGQAVTHVKRCEERGGTYIPIDDGEDIVFANTKINDGSEKSELLQLFLRRDAFHSEKYPQISEAVRFFKETEGGRGIVCKTIEDYGNARCAEVRIEMIADILANGTEDDARRLVKASDSEIESARKLLRESES